MEATIIIVVDKETAKGWSQEDIRQYLTQRLKVAEWSTMEPKPEDGKCVVKTTIAHPTIAFIWEEK